ncbi:MAG: selenide, water dikinase SelD [Candidatus Baltobacteraceae bacterium]
MDANVLAQVLRELPKIEDPAVLVGTSTSDDAGVYRINETLALVQTLDFFTPIVDDPHTFGAIAAANALSDVYAMGAKPVSALAIAAFPETLDPAILHAILLGGSEKAREAGIDVIGGHTVKDAEPKYGLSVTGIVHPDRVIRNSTAKAADTLFLTKAIGTGILTTARRSDKIDDAALREAIASMLLLNRAASEAMIECGAHAATDVTGFGLVGHLRELLAGSGVGADISAQAVPVLAHALDLARRGVVPGGTRTNAAQALDAGVIFDDTIEEAMRLLLCDAQTSGGLLVAISPGDAARFEERARARGVAIVAQIGATSVKPGLRVHS